MEWKIKNDLPIHNQLVEQLEFRIITGFYPVGKRLPSVRDLALEAKVNPNTMQRALVELESKGLIHTKRTSGKYVEENDLIIKKTKEKLAKELTSTYISNMKGLGFDSQTIQKYLNERMDK